MREYQQAVEYEEELLFEYLEADNIDSFREVFGGLYHFDQAKWFVKLEQDDRLRMYGYLSPEEMAAVFENIGEENEDYEAYLSEMDPVYAAQMLEQMYADDAVDVLNEIDHIQAQGYLNLMEDQAAQEIRDLLHYKEYTAGSIMTTELVAVFPHQTVKSVLRLLKREAPNAETIYYTYVVDDERRLAGVISLRDLIVGEDNDLIAEIMNKRVYSVSVHEDQEEVARKIQNYNFMAVPVVDDEDHLVGIITVDDIVDVIREEATDDYSKLAALPDEELGESGPFASAKRRLPWLLGLLVLGMATSAMVSYFENPLKELTVLFAFVPLVAAMAGNSGIQALASSLRRIADRREEPGMGKNVAKEAAAAVLTGASTGVFAFLIIFIWKGSLALGLLVGASILIALIVSAVIGSIIPLVMTRLKVDPAFASGPFITTLNDFISILIYLSLAAAFAKQLL
ncbi:magnesium transporter [Metabacillus sp. GX 13764]|uniref:magnesium transporter n=1 Tax=Metabacillus kandeliae TaxID=2900151 RepID=UPI001E40112C|nr:magnesium transporter [Metabacillus kandeliae]MCD7034992.1 magnesium transporter [Metabacillus kandeliae]